MFTVLFTEADRRNKRGEEEENSSVPEGENMEKFTEEKRLTLRLLLIRCDGAYEVLGRHVNLGVSVLSHDLQRGEVAENLVRC